jgi:hypothetical protein
VCGVQYGACTPLVSSESIAPRFFMERWSLVDWLRRYSSLQT